MVSITDFSMYDGSRPFGEEDAQRFLNQAFAMTLLLGAAMEDGDSTAQHRARFEAADCSPSWPSKVDGTVPESAFEEMSRDAKHLAIDGIRTLIALGAHLAAEEADTLRAEVRALKGFAS